jgi:hypothetical protein
VLLIASRIAQGIFQRELPRRLSVRETQVSRDERNKYFGITLERDAKILDAQRTAADPRGDRTAATLPRRAGIMTASSSPLA